jgi:hypothetical protein
MEKKLSDFTKYYDSNIEEYIFNVISKKFKDGLDAIDFFIICNWKSNRILKLIYNGLKTKCVDDKINIDDYIKRLTRKLYEEADDNKRLGMLTDIEGIHLAMASAILTVLDKEKYTIYDFRACEHRDLKQFKKLKDKEKGKITWKDYKEYIDAVKKIQKEENIINLRETDKALWGISFMDDLKNNIKDGFKKQ